MSDLRCIAILYQGDELRTLDMNDIIKLIENRGNIQKGTKPYGIQMTGDEIVARCVQPIIPHSVVNPKSELTPEENAIIYIGTLFKSDLSDGDDLHLNFIQNFSVKYAFAKTNGTDPELVKAVDIIANTHPLRISNSVMVKYRITKEVINVIVRVGNV
jgi:hypothetical protein